MNPIQRASCSLYYGANSDIQQLLISYLDDQNYKPNDEDVEYETDLLDSDLSGLNTGDCL